MKSITYKKYLKSIIPRQRFVSNRDVGKIAGVGTT
jgi:hypothetical protein